jgi:Fic family protein
VPPPPHELSRVIGDLEQFIHAKDDTYLPLIKAALIHSQFETIHPFSDGNGRTGRMLVTMFLWQEKLLEIPVLFLSAFFNKHRKLYYERLQGYHSEPSNVEAWVEFFLEGVIETAGASIEISRKITKVRENDMERLQTLGKASAESGLVLLKNLYRQPIVDIAKVMEWTKFSRMGAQKVINRFIEMGILTQRNPKEKYGRLYEYRAYLKIFDKE